MLPIRLSRGDSETPIEFLNAIFPNAVKTEINKDNATFLFCPDDTCTMIEAAWSSSFYDDSIAYLYYFGDYYDLEKWRQVNYVRSKVAAYIKKSARSCINIKIDKKECIELFLRRRIRHVSYVRYDESESHIEPIW